MVTSATTIANMALARIGAKRIDNIGTDTSIEAVQSNLHYEPARDALLRSHTWGFAMARQSLSVDPTAPEFGFDYRFALPADCIRVVSLTDTDGSYSIQGRYLLCNETTAEVEYIARVTDVSQFDPMFTELLVLKLAMALVMPLAQDKGLRESLAQETRELEARARLVNRVETNGTGRRDQQTWNDARYTNRGAVVSD